MWKKWTALLGLVALLAACAHPATRQQAQEPWNGGVWNSVLGYHGPANEAVDSGPSR